MIMEGLENTESCGNFGSTGHLASGGRRDITSAESGYKYT